MQLERLVRDLRHFLYPLLVGLSLCLGSAQAKEIVTYYHNDALGSPIAATDEKGNLIWREEYTPYGERILRQATDREPIGYTGKPEEAALGLTYFGARWYDPSLGRFLSPDPVPFQEDNPHSFNRYGYANANPYKFVDPDGAYFDLAIEGISIATGIASFKQNLDEGNIGAAILDGAGVVIDTGMALVPGAAGGVGLGIKALREGSERAGKSAISNAAKKPIVIGENMKRVKEYADQIGGHAYRPWKNDPFDFDLSMKRNEQWIREQIINGREIIDIGPDFQRRAVTGSRSPFYETERRNLQGYENYRRVFERSGNQGGVPGLDF